ncbi:hypothetical protein DPMN_000567 [Dreissena polymorpha]|uniref:Uncharacterized protein n=1 Tax=Dreissena polymorpha TaxID=45954 RepID=A0A9D4RRW9_DREPO|nr:hypothetical protein DPMN_000567 [Dreissena polymorpha]
MPRPLEAIFFQANIIIFELIQDIIETNLLTKFHDDRKINVTPRVLTKKNAPPPKFHEDRTINQYKENAPPLGSHVFEANVTIFELIHDINKTNLLTIFHEDWTKKYIIGMNLLTKFHEDWTINVASRVLTRFHVFQAKFTIFKLIQDSIGTNLLTKFYKDRKINVASRVLTRLYHSNIRKNAPPPGGHVFQPTGIIF